MTELLVRVPPETPADAHSFWPATYPKSDRGKPTAFRSNAANPARSLRRSRSRRTARSNT